MAVCVYMEINLLFLSQVLYNKAYSELQLGRRQQCDELLENGREIASGVSESRHRIITSAIESLKAGKTFLPYRLPKSCMWFLPPRNKTDVIKPVNFLKPAKVSPPSQTGTIGTVRKTDTAQTTTSIVKTIPFLPLSRVGCIINCGPGRLYRLCGRTG
jgi:hypothetical protein